jgi:GT2 family glycosyltransferase
LYHKVSSSSGGDDSPFYVYYGNRNKIYFIRKNYRGLHKAWLLAYALVSRVGFYLRYDSVGKEKLLAAIRDGFRMKVGSD